MLHIHNCSVQSVTVALMLKSAEENNRPLDPPALMDMLQPVGFHEWQIVQGTELVRAERQREKCKGIFCRSKLLRQREARERDSKQEQAQCSMWRGHGKRVLEILSDVAKPSGTDWTGYSAPSSSGYVCAPLVKVFM